MNKSIAILIPCFNEETTVSKVIRDFQKEIPDAKIYVHDNNSTDHPKAILVGFGKDLEKPFINYAQEHKYKPKRLSNGNTLWLSSPKTTSF